MDKKSEELVRWSSEIGLEIDGIVNKEDTFYPKAGVIDAGTCLRQDTIKLEYVAPGSNLLEKGMELLDLPTRSLKLNYGCLFPFDKVVSLNLKENTTLGPPQPRVNPNESFRVEH